MRAHFGLPSITSGERDDGWKKPISVKFEIPYFTVSGIQVRYLKIIEKVRCRQVLGPGREPRFWCRSKGVPPLTRFFD